MADRKFQNPVYLTVRMEKELHSICKRLRINFTDLINQAALEVIPIQLEKKNLSSISKKDIEAIIQVKERELEATNELIHLLRTAEKKRLKAIEEKKRESEVQKAIEKEKEDRYRQIDARRELLELFYSLCLEHRVVSEGEAISFEERLINTDEDQVYPVHAELRNLFDERLTSLNGTGDQIKEILEKDENPMELIEKTISWIAMDARKRRVW